MIAGAENKNVVAGPMPAPRLYIPAKRGSTVQLQTASRQPETAATVYETYLGASAPKNFSTDSLEKREAIAPQEKGRHKAHQYMECQVLLH